MYIIVRIIETPYILLIIIGVALCLYTGIWSIGIFLTLFNERCILYIPKEDGFFTEIIRRLEKRAEWKEQ